MSMATLVDLGFYFFAPLLLGVAFAFKSPLPAQFQNRCFSLMFWVIQEFLGWWAVLLGALAVFWATQSFGPPTWIVLIIGGMLGALVFSPVFERYFKYSRALTVEGSEWPDVLPVGLNLPFVKQFLQQAIPGLVIFIPVYYAFRLFLGLDFLIYG